VSFNPKHQNLLGCGCSNGTVSIFDISDGVTQNLLCSSKLEESHNDAITDFVWLRSRNGTEFVTTSTDGKVIWWDIKEFSTPQVFVCPENPEKPLMLVDKEGEVEKEYGGVRIEYNPEAGATKYLIATEQGTIFSANKKKQDADFINKLGFKWGRHLGPVCGIQRNPTHNKYVLTVGDWTSRVINII